MSDCTKCTQHAIGFVNPCFHNYEQVENESGVIVSKILLCPKFAPRRDAAAEMQQKYEVV